MENHTQQQTKCITQSLPGSMTPAWSWLAFAQYTGNRTINGALVYVWSANVFDLLLELGVLAADSSQPVFFNTVIPGHSFRNVTFVYFTEADCLSPSIFEVPAACISSNDMVAVKAGKRPQLPKEFQAKVQVRGEGRRAKRV